MVRSYPATRRSPASINSVGESNGFAKLKDGQARELYVRWHAGYPGSQRELGEEYGVSDYTVSLIVRGVRYAHATCDIDLDRIHDYLTEEPVNTSHKIVSRIANEFGLRMPPPGWRSSHDETIQSPHILYRILRGKGEDHLRQVLWAIVNGFGTQRAHLDGAVVDGMSQALDQLGPKLDTCRLAQALHTAGFDAVHREARELRLNNAQLELAGCIAHVIVHTYLYARACPNGKPTNGRVK